MEDRTRHDEFLYDAFISYRHTAEDRKWAKWLHASLESYRVPRELVARGVPPRLTRVFRDEEELAASSDLSREIEAALRQSRALIVICSPETPKSRWVEQEVTRFRQFQRSDRIFSLLIAGEPQQSFPHALFEVRQSPSDGAARPAEFDASEPLAADVRPEPGANSRTLARMAKLKIIAGLLGCRFDELRQREHERRIRFLRRAVGSLVCVLLLIAGLATAAIYEAVNASNSRDQAQRELDELQNTLADSILRPVDPSALNGVALESFMQLSMLPPEHKRVRLYFFRNALKRLETASQLRSHAELAVHAALGGDLDLRAKLLSEILLPEMKSAVNEDDQKAQEIGLACVVVGNCADAAAMPAGAEFSKLACKMILNAWPARTTDAKECQSLANEFARSAQGLAANDADQLYGDFLDMIEAAPTVALKDAGSATLTRLSADLMGRLEPSRLEARLADIGNRLVPAEQARRNALHQAFLNGLRLIPPADARTQAETMLSRFSAAERAKTAPLYDEILAKAVSSADLQDKSQLDVLLGELIEAQSNLPAPRLVELANAIASQPLPTEHELQDQKTLQAAKILIRAVGENASSESSIFLRAAQRLISLLSPDSIEQAASAAIEATDAPHGLSLAEVLSTCLNVVPKERSREMAKRIAATLLARVAAATDDRVALCCSMLLAEPWIAVTDDADAYVTPAVNDSLRRLDKSQSVGLFLTPLAYLAQSNAGARLIAGSVERICERVLQSPAEPFNPVQLAADLAALRSLSGTLPDADARKLQLRSLSWALDRDDIVIDARAGLNRWDQLSSAVVNLCDGCAPNDITERITNLAAKCANVDKGAGRLVLLLDVGAHLAARMPEPEREGIGALLAPLAVRSIAQATARRDFAALVEAGASVISMTHTKEFPKFWSQANDLVANHLEGSGDDLTLVARAYAAISIRLDAAQRAATAQRIGEYLSRQIDEPRRDNMLAPASFVLARCKTFDVVADDLPRDAKAQLAGRMLRYLRQEVFKAGMPGADWAEVGRQYLALAKRQPGGIFRSVQSLLSPSGDQFAAFQWRHVGMTDIKVAERAVHLAAELLSQDPLGLSEIELVRLLRYPAATLAVAAPPAAQAVAEQPEVLLRERLLARLNERLGRPPADFWETMQWLRLKRPDLYQHVLDPIVRITDGRPLPERSTPQRSPILAVGY